MSFLLHIFILIRIEFNINRNANVEYRYMEVDSMEYKRVEDDLKPHNQETIKKILKFYETSNKCCAIQATGTGKTFLILRLLEIYNDADKKAVIFAPNREIIKQTKEKMRKYNLNNAIFYTYQKLARMSDDEIFNIKADLIVCDELHRTGAKTWGKKFEEMVNTHSDAKVFGVTATPLRCEDGRDMAEEYFDGNRACDISLAEALVREIIPVMPTYISALYTFDEEYSNMTQKIEKANNTMEEKEDFQKELLAAKQQLEKANGVSEIIKKYITNYNGKYIVFCKDKKHLYAMRDVVIGWFRDSGYRGDVFEYSYYSNNSAVKMNLENFKNNKEYGLKLLFVIDKLNEGLHINEVDGCILLRTTSSNIIYYQQIGRVIDAGNSKQRIILDLVCNFDNLKVFNFKHEIEVAIEKRRNGQFKECDTNFEIGKFNIIDLTQDCRKIFNRIDNKLYDTWDVNYNALKIFYKKYGHSNVPERFTVEVNGESIQLGAFVNRIRRGSVIMNCQRRRRLDEVEFVFDIKKKFWNDVINELKKYKKMYGNCNVPVNYIIYKDGESFKLGQILHTLRKNYNHKLYTVDQKIVDEFVKIGFIFDLQQTLYKEKINQIKQYCKENNCNINDIKAVNNDRDQTRIAVFIRNEAQKLRDGKYNTERLNYRKNLLYSIGIKPYQNKHDRYWEIMFNGWIDAKTKYGKQIPKTYKVDGGGILKYWIDRQRSQIKSGKLSDERKSLLIKNGLMT